MYDAMDIHVLHRRTAFQHPYKGEHTYGSDVHS